MQGKEIEIHSGLTTEVVEETGVRRPTITGPIN